MLNLDQDTFITQYVTAFLAADAVHKTHKGTSLPLEYRPPVAVAMAHARRAYHELIYIFGPPRPWTSNFRGGGTGGQS
jgi:hypothetical protein